MTLAELYRQHWGQADPRTIAAAARRLTNRQVHALSLHARGAPTRLIGRTLGISHGAARELVMRGLAAMHKRIAGLPRYHITGRGQAPTPAPARPTK
jgi:DNA-binding NarL/FixJ family response regulator